MCVKCYMVIQLFGGEQEKHVHTDISNSKYLRGKHGIVFDGTKKIDYAAKEREEINNVANRIIKYFNREPNTLNSQYEFDLFHNELCDAFITFTNC